MKQNEKLNKKPFQMDFDVSTLKHLGMQMYSTLPSVIGELVANAWDANATRVEITIPEGPIDDDRSEIIINDDGIGMSDLDIREKYLIVGRDRRAMDRSDRSPAPKRRKVMGRKGIGKFSAFGIAKVIEIESAMGDEVSHFVMDYDAMLKRANERRIAFESLAPTDTVSHGTRIKLRRITKFKSRAISKNTLRRGLARRFSILGPSHKFAVSVNGSEISVEERNMKLLLARDSDNKPYLWEINDEKIASNTDLTVSGWIGALERTDTKVDEIERGISILARGKLVQKPFVFDAVVGQQYALSYFVGEIHAEFVDESEDTIATSRNELVWDTYPNIELKKWGQRKVNDLARAWSTKRSKDNDVQLHRSPLFQTFMTRANDIGNKRAIKLAESLVRQSILKNPTASSEELNPIIQNCLDFLEFDKFSEIAQAIVESDLEDVGKILDLFREWEVVEAMELSRVTRGRVETIKKLQELIDSDVLEVPVLHKFFREFPWTLDPRWTLVADEVSYSELLRRNFPEEKTVPECNRRLDFLCVRESDTLVVVEIKRPGSRISIRDLGQIEEYVGFIRHHIKSSTDHQASYRRVAGYLFCGYVANKPFALEKIENLEKADIYVRKYVDLLGAVRRYHAQIIEKYDALKKLRDSKV